MNVEGADSLASRSFLSALATVGITRRKIKRLDAIVNGHEPQNSCKHRAYAARPFVLCGIPIRRPAKHTLEYSRQNGRFRLRVLGHPDYGLPFGQDRLLLIWIASMATWQKRREIRFRSAAEILDTFSLPKDGRYYKRLVAGFERIFTPRSISPATGSPRRRVRGDYRSSLSPTLAHPDHQRRRPSHKRRSQKVNRGLGFLRLRGRPVAGGR